MPFNASPFPKSQRFPSPKTKQLSLSLSPSLSLSASPLQPSNSSTNTSKISHEQTTMDTPPSHYHSPPPPLANTYILSPPHTMPVSGHHHTPDDSLSHKLTSKTPVLGLKLYVLVAICLACLLILAIPIFICLLSNRRSKRSKMRVKSHISNEINNNGINGSDRVDGVDKIGSYYEGEKEKEVPDVELGKLVGGKIGSSVSNLSSLSGTTSLGSAAAAEGMGMGWGRWYSWSELEVATRGFNEGNVIGEGGYGVVYRGVLVDGSVVAVKNLLNNK